VNIKLMFDLAVLYGTALLSVQHHQQAPGLSLPPPSPVHKRHARQRSAPIAADLSLAPIR
jgi:hypothetical protein